MELVQTAGDAGGAPPLAGMPVPCTTSSWCKHSMSCWLACSHSWPCTAPHARQLPGTAALKCTAYHTARCLGLRHVPCTRLHNQQRPTSAHQHPAKAHFEEHKLGGLRRHK